MLLTYSRDTVLYQFDGRMIYTIVPNNRVRPMP